MIERLLKEELHKELEQNAAVVLVGARQVGKTTLAWEMIREDQAVYLDLENRLDLEKVRDIHAFYAENNRKLIILDEVQRLPDIFASIRGIIDQNRREGNKFRQFLFLGSASIDLLKQSSESLAGRIAILELFTINALEYPGSEIASPTLTTLWLKGGFPESLLADEDRSMNWRYNYIKTYLERDIPQLGPRIPAETLERFWTMLAHNQGETINYSKIAANINVSGVTVARYVDIMVDLLLIRKLKPWTANTKKRLVKSPRIYVRDSGITHALLNISSYNNLLSHPVVGKSWEGFVIENIISVLPPGVRPYFYRTAGGAEIDLLLEVEINKLWAIEIKHGSFPKLEKGFFEACKDLKPEKKFVIYTGNDTFKVASDVKALSLPEFMKLLRTYGNQ